MAFNFQSKFKYGVVIIVALGLFFYLNGLGSNTRSIGYGYYFSYFEESNLCTLRKTGDDQMGGVMDGVIFYIGKNDDGYVVLVKKH